jgi:hypothetical protein
LKNLRLPLWLLASFLATLLLSCFSILQRDRVEARNKAVAMATEYEYIESFAASQGLTAEQGITKLQSSGLNAIVLNDETIADLVQTGEVELHGNKIRPLTPMALARVIRGLSIRFGRPFPGVGFSGVINAPVDSEILRSVSVGLDPNQTGICRAAGLTIVGRFGNPVGVTPTQVQQTLAWGHELGASIYLPMGEQVLGRKDAIQSTIDALKQYRMLYATPEFAKIGGDANIVGAAPDIVVRLHSAQVAELDKMPFADVVERYARAARERNMRVLLIRPETYGSSKPLDEFGHLLKTVGDRIKAEGGEIAPPHAFTAPQLPRWWPILVALAAFPTVYFGAALAVRNQTARRVGALLLAIAALGAWTKIGAQVDAFLISLAFPFVAYVALDRLRPKSILLSCLLVSAVSLVGAFAIAGMLNGLSYYMQADEFRGVKLSVFFPIVLVGGYFFMTLLDWRKTMRSPITWGTVAIGIVLLITLAVVIARTGNDTGVGASDSELAFRNVLDRFLYVRPRTKEFMVGHPMLVVACGLFALLSKLKANCEPSDERLPVLSAWTTIALMVSAIGQTSILNTMSHIHIPVLLSIARVFEGLLIGLIIGAAIWAIGYRLIPRRFRVE